MNKKNIIRSYWKISVFLVSLIIFIVMMTLLVTNNVSNFDNKVYEIVIFFKCEPLTYFLKFITFLCSTWFILFLSILIMLFNKSKKNAFYIVLNILICSLLNHSLKILFARSRPVNINLITETGYSFPSGHSMLSLAFYGFIIYIIGHKRLKKNKKVLYGSLLTLLVLLIGISRIYLGVHYASDVLAGYALSTAYLIIYIKLFYKRMKK